MTLKRQADADTLKQVPEKTLSVSALCSRTSLTSFQRGIESASSVAMGYVKKTNRVKKNSIKKIINILCFLLESAVSVAMEYVCMYGKRVSS